MALFPEQIELLRVAKAGLIRQRGTVIQRWSAHSPSSDVTVKVAPLIRDGYLEAAVTGYYFPTAVGEAVIIADDQQKAAAEVRIRRELVAASLGYDELARRRNRTQVSPT